MDTNLEKQLSSWLKKQKKACGFYLNLVIVFGLFTGLSLIVQAYLISKILHGIIILNQPESDFTMEFIFLLVLIPIRGILAFARERSSFEAGKRLRLEIRGAVLDKLSELGPAFIKGKPAGSWASIVLEQVEDLHDFYGRYLPQMFIGAFVPLSILAVIFPLNWAAGLIFLCTAPLIPLFMILVGMGAASANQKNFTALSKLSGHFMDRLRGLSTLKLFNQGEAEIREIEKASELFREKTIGVLRIAFLSSAVLEFFAALSIAVTAIYFGLTYLDFFDFGDYGNGVTLFTGLFVLMLAPEFYQPLRDMGAHYHAKAQAVGAAEELMNLLEYKTENNSNLPLGVKKIDKNKKIEIAAENLIVRSYSGTKLAGPISFLLEGGKHMAVVGPSGAGKTSLLNALLGFLPYEGSLKINGIELKELDISKWRTNLAWLGQDPQLFHGTIRDNVAMSNPDMDDDLVFSLLEKANVLEFVNAQPLGIDHQIREEMAGVSVGVAQRIALARALGQDAGIFLLDEPTASLDRHSEKTVLNALYKAMENLTCIMVTHRLDQLDKMDKILVLDKGLVVQEGHFSELKLSPGLFNEMERDDLSFDNKPGNSARELNP